MAQKNRYTALDLEVAKTTGFVDRNCGDMVPTKDEVDQSRRLVEEIRRGTPREETGPRDTNHSPS